MKPQDSKAEAITFGVELETIVPLNAHLEVGGYHRGQAVTHACDSQGRSTQAPDFRGESWKAERDGSIGIMDGYHACEFVSPVLHGADGVEHLLEFLAWVRSLGARVNNTCGCHITVGVESIIGTRDPQAMSQFARKLAHLARWHAKGLYGQTGTGRHLNHYSHTLDSSVGRLVRRMERSGNWAVKTEAAQRCGRGMVNFRKLFSHGVIEFRVFAGTLNRHKLMHHLGTVLGLCRRAAEVRCLGGFFRNKAQSKRTADANAALRYLWDFLGWTGSKRPVALGLIGPLHEEFAHYRRTAERMCHRFDQRFPDALV